MKDKIKKFLDYIEELEIIAEREGYDLTELGCDDDVKDVFRFLAEKGGLFDE